MHRSKIEWVLNPDNKTLGWIWNPLTGCLNHVNGMCKGGGFPCYAYRLANTRLKERYLANEHIAGINPHESVPYIPAGMRELELRNPFYPREWFSRRERALESKRAEGVFVCDMSDLFGIGIPESWTECVLETIKVCPEYRFYLLTKQPQNLTRFSPFPDNCWIGVSVCNDKMLDVAVDKLEDIQATHKFFSFEPLKERLTLSLDYALYYSGVSWLIIGAQTKPYKPPKIEWVREIVEAADKAGVAVFLKNSLNDLIPPNGSHEPFLRYGPAGELRLRQEMPK